MNQIWSDPSQKNISLQKKKLRQSVARGKIWAIRLRTSSPVVPYRVTLASRLRLQDSRSHCKQENQRSQYGEDTVWPMNGHANPDERISVLIADSNLIRIQLFTRELQRNGTFSIANCENNPLACKSALKTFPADVLLWAQSSQCEINQVFSGMREVLSSRSSVRGVALLEAWSDDSVVRAFRVGVRGLFSLEQASLPELRKCILCVFRNQVWATNEQILLLLETFKGSSLVQIANAKGEGLLTPRQRQLVQLVAEGMGNREVAQNMNITENTVKKSLLRIFDKVGVSNRVELVLSALASRNLDSEKEAAKATGKSPVSAGQFSENREDELA